MAGWSKIGDQRSWCLRDSSSDSDNGAESVGKSFSSAIKSEAGKAQAKSLKQAGKSTSAPAPSPAPKSSVGKKTWKKSKSVDADYM